MKSKLGQKFVGLNAVLYCSLRVALKQNALLERILDQLDADLFVDWLTTVVLTNIYWGGDSSDSQ